MAFLLHAGQVAGKGGEETAKSEVAAAAEEEAREREAQHDGLHDVHDAERDRVGHRRRRAAAQAEGREPREALPPQRARQRRRQPGRAAGGRGGQPPPPAPGQVVPRDELLQPPATRPRRARRSLGGRGHGRRLRNRNRPRRRRRRVRLDNCHWPRCRRCLRVRFGLAGKDPGFWLGIGRKERWDSGRRRALLLLPAWSGELEARPGRIIWEPAEEVSVLRSAPPEGVFRLRLVPKKSLRGIRNIEFSDIYMKY